MSSFILPQKTLVQTLRHGENVQLRNLCLVILASAALWVSAKIQIPFWPVPMTMQTFVVLTIGMALGWRLGTIAVLFYFVQGALGLPVFSGTPEKGIGIAYISGPTGGYLIGFIIAVGVVGWLAEKGWSRNVFTTAAAFLIGNIFIYVPGLFWLGVVLGRDVPILEFGLYLFLPGDAFKLMLAAVLFPVLWRGIETKEQKRK